jgi:hypothetical protein
MAFSSFESKAPPNDLLTGRLKGYSTGLILSFQGCGFNHFDLNVMWKMKKCGYAVMVSGKASAEVYLNQEFVKEIPAE